MNRKYEIITIISPDLKEEMDAAQDKVVKLIESHSGNILEKDNWGSKALPYLVEKFKYGYFLFFLVSIGGDKVAELKKDFKLSNDIIRYSVYIPNKE